MRIFRLLLLGACLLAAAARADGPQYRLGVDGVACAFCAAGVEKRLKGIEGIESVEADLGKGLVVIHMREGASLTEEQAREQVEKAGFSLRTFTRGETRGEEKS
ncbi:heavy-metal-associated domain-containing protein [Microbulbifer magnicolonia]|uniref:heavy-metal-associated domain-containing protein n=1 Tax=Microbulbifer magnicolonia TaxID=3109744 RepID=UPI002B40D81C|nr:heavy-metal-associated domain-containing protein [Microbulbifer sp. GG15]